MVINGDCLVVVWLRIFGSCQFHQLWPFPAIGAWGADGVLHRREWCICRVSLLSSLCIIAYLSLHLERWTVAGTVAVALRWRRGRPGRLEQERWAGSGTDPADAVVLL